MLKRFWIDDRENRDLHSFFPPPPPSPQEITVSALKTVSPLRYSRLIGQKFLVASENCI